MTSDENLHKATTVADAIRLLDGKRPLEYGKAEWDALYTETSRKKSVDQLINAFLRQELGYKVLFGGHSGNGKSTELNRFKGHSEINATFQVIAADVSESLNPIDLEIVELLLMMVVETLELADKRELPIEPSLRRRYEELEGLFTGSLVIEEERSDKSQKELETSTEASVGYPGFLVKLKAKLMAKIKAQADYRKTVRTTFRPRLNNLVELLDDVLTALSIHDSRRRKPLIVLDGLDRMSVGSAKKLYASDGQTLALIRNACMLLTVPISIIHSPESSQVASALGKIHVFENLRLWDRDGEVDDLARKNRESLKELLFKRMNSSLITDSALDKAIRLSGGVFRTLLDLVSEAANIADTDGQVIIDDEAVGDAVRQAKISKSRPMRHKHWTVLDEIDQNKSFHLDREDETLLQLLQGLFALEYINGDEWYEVNPLLRDGLDRFREREARMKGNVGDA